MDDSGCRRLLALVKNLPPESGFALRSTKGWNDAQELRAAQVEVTHALYRATLKAAGAKTVPKQIRVPRPALHAVGRRPASDAETVAFFTTPKGR